MQQLSNRRQAAPPPRHPLPPSTHTHTSWLAFCCLHEFSASICSCSAPPSFPSCMHQGAHPPPRRVRGFTSEQQPPHTSKCTSGLLSWQLYQGILLINQCGNPCPVHNCLSSLPVVATLQCSRPILGPHARHACPKHLLCAHQTGKYRLYDLPGLPYCCMAATSHRLAQCSTLAERVAVKQHFQCNSCCSGTLAIQ